MNSGYILTKFPLPSKEGDNYQMYCSSFIVLNEECGPMIFDTGSPYDTDSFLSQLKDNFNLVPEDFTWVFHTHLHPDHVGNTVYFKNANVVMSREDLKTSDYIANLVFTNGDLKGFLHSEFPDYPSFFNDFQISVMRDNINKFWTHENIGLNGRELFIEDNPVLPMGIVPFKTPGHIYNHYSFKFIINNVWFYVTGDALSNRYSLVNEIEIDPESDPHMDLSLFKETLSDLRNLCGVFIPGHDRPLDSLTFKGIRRNVFDLEKIAEDFNSKSKS